MQSVSRWFRRDFCFINCLIPLPRKGIWLLEEKIESSMLTFWELCDIIVFFRVDKHFFLD